MTLSMNPKRWLLLLLGLTVLLLTACGERDPARKELIKALDDTREQNYRFVYIDERADETIEVRGSIEDDFRVAARVATDGKFTYDEIVNDDSMALRFYEPTAVKRYLDPAATDADTKTDLEGVETPAVLASRRWVVDPTGAPLFTSRAGSEATFGQDPVRDAMTVLDYVEQAVRESIAVEEFNPDDLSPVFSSSEDVFPKPPPTGPVKRYDLRRPPLPAVGVDAQGDGNDTFATRHFRKMVIYVEDGIVIRVLERVEIIGKQVPDVVGRLRRLYDEVELPQQVRDQFESLVESTPEDELGVELLGFINFGQEAFGLQPVLERNMSIDLLDHGKFSAIALPSPDGNTVVNGSLEVMVMSGYARNNESTSSGSPDDGATTETDSEETDADADPDNETRSEDSFDDGADPGDGDAPAEGDVSS